MTDPDDSALAGAGIRAADRALAALDFLVDAAPRTVRVTDVAHHLEVTPATASRLLATLVGRGYASRTPDRRFTVGPRSVSLATRWMGRIQTAAAGPMARVADATGETVIVDQLLGDRDTPIAWRYARSWSPEEVRRLSGEAASFPLWATAAGRALLGTLPPAQRARLLPPEPYPRLTARTLTTWNSVRDSIRAGAKDGLHVDSGETISDLWCCSAGLERGADGEVLAIAVVCLGEPSVKQRAKITRALRYERRDLGFTLSVVS